eukprot:8645018-Alexandrium_andersonii.AAC.1
MDRRGVPTFARRPPNRQFGTTCHRCSWKPEAVYRPPATALAREANVRCARLAVSPNNAKRCQ